MTGLVTVLSKENETLVVLDAFLQSRSRPDFLGYGLMKDNAHIGLKDIHGRRARESIRAVHLSRS